MREYIIEFVTHTGINSIARYDTSARVYDVMNALEIAKIEYRAYLYVNGVVQFRLVLP